MIAAVAEAFARMRRGEGSRRRFEEDLAAIVGADGSEHALKCEAFGGRRVSVELPRDLWRGEPTGGAQVLVQAVNAVGKADVTDDPRRETLAGTGAQPPSVKGLGDLPIGQLGSERAHLFDDDRWSPA